MKTKLLVLFSVLLCMTIQAAAPWDGTTIASSFAGGTGTSTDPYQISSPAELAFLSQSVNGGTTYSGVYFILTSDLDLNRKPWTPIGTADDISFQGKFDGNAHLISNVNVNLPTTTGVGLFGYIRNALIKNLGIVGESSVSGLGSVGGIIGRCYITAAVSGIGISGCFSNATVSSTGDCSGGVVGIVRTTGTRAYTIDNCYSIGNITGNNYVAGIVGKIEQLDLSISNSYSAGLITATATDSRRGGIVTKVSTDAVTVTNCYYIDGDASNANGAVAKTATEMQEATFLTLINNSSSNWKADFSGANSVNNGFPIHSWRIEPVATSTTNSLISNGKVTITDKTVNFETSVSIKNIELYTLNGLLVKSINTNYTVRQFSFDVQHAGIYLLIAHTTEGQLSQKVFIK